ncbi:phage major capsid protein [Hymenobacter guriensis]|uniref:Phage major capsid protein n=1 Tax=Hymenobacter guriensis TaxID=2793065 RepID=A0ABS0KWX8_9BACT|nr:phage major capsid protein [Hymenobacter guriensis]MBG8552350.1 phage major capsid protein [Hymenobacter guriensis]
MKNLQQLREERTAKIDAASALFAKAKTENRSLTDEEKAQVRTLQSEADTLKGDIDIAERQEANDRELAGRTEPVSRNNHNTTEARDIAKYSLMKAVRAAPGYPGGKPLEGIEKEMHQQAEADARSAGSPLKGVGVPQMLLESRDNGVTEVTPFTQPEDGAAVVDRTLRPVIDLSRPRTVLRELGAQFLTGTVGNVGVPSLTQGAVSTWKAENTTLDKSNQKFSSAEMTPHRLGTFAVRTLQFLNQTSRAYENMLRTDIENSIMEALEIASINGSGSNNQPLGILNTPGVLSLAMGTNGGAPTREMLIALEALVEDQNIRMDSPGYLINVQTKAKLKNTKVDAGSGIFLMNSNNELNGQRVATTTLVPKNLTKGTASGVASAAIFGNWRDLLIPQWGGLDITVDPYTLATEGEVRIIIQSFFDVLVQRPKAFAAVKDILTT